MWSPFPASLSNRNTQRPLATYASRYLKPCRLPREGVGSLQTTIYTEALWLSTRCSRSSNSASLLLTLATALGIVYESNTCRDFRSEGSAFAIQNLALPARVDSGHSQTVGETWPIGGIMSSHLSPRQPVNVP